MSKEVSAIELQQKFIELLNGVYHNGDRLIEKLIDREEALGYLQVSLEEYLIDGDTPFFLKGVRSVVEAQGGIPKVAEQAGISPDALSKFLFSEGPLHLGTLSTIIKTFG